MMRNNTVQRVHSAGHYVLREELAQCRQLLAEARQVILEARRAWLEDNDPQDGTDVVTPYDAILYKL